MSRIFIDTDELRDIAADLRHTTGELGEMLGRLGAGFDATWMPVGPHFRVRERGQEAQMRVLALRVHNDANSLVIEATRREAEEWIREVTADVMGGVRWSLRVLDEAWDWTAREVRGPLSRLGRGAWNVVKTVGRSLVVAIVVFVSTVPGIGWVVRKVRRNVDYHHDVQEPPASEVARPKDPFFVPSSEDLRQEPPQMSFGDWIARLQREPFSYADYMRVIGAMAPGTVVVLKVGGDCPPRWVVLIRGIAIARDDPGRSYNRLDNAALEEHLDWGPYEDAIEEAMRKAGVVPGDRLMLMGHSQGAIAARNLTADRRFTHTYQVDAVVTGGAEVDNGFPVVDSRTHAVALFNDKDPVTYANLQNGLDDLAQRGVEVNDHFSDPTPAKPEGGLFDAHHTDHYARELERLAPEPGGGTGDRASVELRRPPLSEYVGHPPEPNGVHVVSVLAHQ